MIHICFGLYDKTGRYSKFTGTAMLSIFENAITPPRLPSITVHILHDNTLTQDNHDKFIYLAGRYGQLVKFYNVEEFCADKISEMLRLIPTAETSSFSVATLYRLIIPQVLSKNIDKVIYLDSDIFVNLDIKELWQIELGDKMFAAVPEMFNGINTIEAFYLCQARFVKIEEYFNAGVLLMNIKLLRGEEDNIMRGVKFVGENPQLIYLDQDVLNYLYAKDYVTLSVKFNFFVREARRINETKIFKRIYHFAGGLLNFNIKDAFNRCWMEYFLKTPWFDISVLERIYDGFQQLNTTSKNSMVNISAMMSGKERAFLTLPLNLEATKRIFSIRDDEDILLAENQESLQKLIDTMKISQGKKVFFILVPNFPLNVLIEAGFVYGKDFLNGFIFLSEENGIIFDTSPLIQAI